MTLLNNSIHNVKFQLRSRILVFLNKPTYKFSRLIICQILNQLKRQVSREVSDQVYNNLRN